MFNKKEKRGRKALSPLITTVLLVLIAIVLAVIIFLWAKGFRGDVITKGYDGEDKDISLSCKQVKFSAELSNGKISIVNQGDFPIYRFDLRVSGATSSETSSSGVINLKPGNSGVVDINLQTGETLELIPVLLGQDENKELKEFSCLDTVVWQSVTA